ncbi:hypothetical protein TAL182_CH00966 [Rhizobium sp. TAL182]|nr:hypothetical protein TAL182_CH00966 [Rhizobium sp. TAL182]
MSGLRPSRGRSSGKEDGLRGGFDPIHDQRIPIEARRRYSEPGMQRCGRARQERQEATGNDGEAVDLFRQAGAKTDSGRRSAFRSFAGETDRPMKRPPRGRSLVLYGRTKPATL